MPTQFTTHCPKCSESIVLMGWRELGATSLHDAVRQAAYKITAKLPNPNCELGRVQAIEEIIYSCLSETLATT